MGETARKGASQSSPPSGFSAKYEGYYGLEIL